MFTQLREMIETDFGPENTHIAIDMIITALVLWVLWGFVVWRVTSIALGSDVVLPAWIEAIWRLIGYIVFPVMVGVWWFKNAFQSVGMDDVNEPYWVVIARFGRPVFACRPGLYVRPLWMFERVILFPSGRKKMWFKISNAYTKEVLEKDGRQRQAQPAKVVFTVYGGFPDPAVKHLWPTGGVDETDTKEVEGKELLFRAFYSLPRSLRNPHVADYVSLLGNFIEGGVIEAMRVQIAKKDHLEIRQENQAIEDGAKRYALLTPGNPCYELGWPDGVLSFDITDLELPDDMNTALRAEEIADRQGRARTQTKHHEADQIRIQAVAEANRIRTLAPAEAERVRILAESLKDLSAIAAFIAAGGGGKEGTGPSTGDLAHLLIAQALGEKSRK